MDSAHIRTMFESIIWQIAYIHYKIFAVLINKEKAEVVSHCI